MKPKTLKKPKTAKADERKRVSASVSARIINALAPLIRQITDMAWSDVNFMTAKK